MYETIQESIQVLASFKKNKVKPLVLRWKGCDYKIKEVNLIHKEKDGEGVLWHFSVSDQSNYFKICFDSRGLSWELEEIYTEG